MDVRALIKTYPSIIPLVLANLVPLGGVLFLGWDLFSILYLYWLESAVIGIFNVIKIIIVGPISSILVVPFFIFHYGMFMSGHLIFLVALFGPKGAQISFPPFGFVLKTMTPGIAVALLFLFGSHTYSFFTNFIGRVEYIRKDVKNQTTDPYQRIVLMHLTIIFGGGLVMWFGKPVAGLVVMVILKIIMDGRAHVKEHARLSKVGSEGR